MNKFKIYSQAINDFVFIVNDVKKVIQDNVMKGKYVNVFSLWNSFSGLPEPIHSNS